MSEPEEKEAIVTADKITIEITLPTKETVIKTLTNLFPGIKVTEKEPTKEASKPETEEPTSDIQ